jgi:hypothetical protein
MVDPKCIKCGGSRFEVLERTIINAKFPINLVQCADCGGVVGALETHNAGRLVIALAEKLNVKI